MGPFYYSTWGSSGSLLLLLPHHPSVPTPHPVQPLRSIFSHYPGVRLTPNKVDEAQYGQAPSICSAGRKVHSSAHQPWEKSALPRPLKL